MVARTHPKLNLVTQALQPVRRRLPACDYKKLATGNCHFVPTSTCSQSVL
jgi:hypothetical protein